MATRAKAQPEPKIVEGMAIELWDVDRLAWTSFTKGTKLYAHMWNGLSRIQEERGAS